MVKMVKVLGIGLVMGLVIASLDVASARTQPDKQAGSGFAVRPSTKLVGYVIVDSGALMAPDAAQSSGQVNCPAGTKPLGGGVLISSSSLLANVNGSYPIATGGSGWGAFVNNNSGSATTFHVYAVCAMKPAGYKVAHAAVTNPPASQTKAVATCPAGSKVLGGGGISSSTSVSANLNTTIPASPKSWRADANNPTGSSQVVTAYAVCGKNVTGWKMVTGSSVSNPAGTETHSVADCPGGRAVLGGGVYSSSFDLNVNINSSYPVSTIEWSGFENNNSGTAATTATYVICATL
jgi:hypothetical protein